MKISITFEADKIDPDWLMGKLAEITVNDCEEMAALGVDQLMAIDDGVDAFRPE